MAHIASQSTGVNADSQDSDCSHDLEDSESAKEGTSNKDIKCFVSGDDGALEHAETENRTSVERLPCANDPTEVASACGSLEDTSCGVKNKKMPKSRKENNKVLKHKGSSDIKVVESKAATVSVALDEQVEGCASLNLATKMELVNSDSTYYGRPGSPCFSSENDWEASDPSSDSDADHSDSSDDDNPKSQVDRWIDCEAIQFMDGENSNLSSETDDTDDDSDSDITDVSPLVSTGTSPLCGLSPAVSRRNLPSAFSNRQPFMRHYSHKGHDGDDEDEEDHHSDYNKWSDDLMLNNHNTSDLFATDHQNDNSDLHHDANMSMVVQALLKLELDRADKTDNEHIINSPNQNNNNKNNDPHNRFSQMIRRHSHMSPALHVNPHHKHLRKHSHPRRKNMSFTNEEVRIINRDNTIMLDKLLAVHNRPEKLHEQSSSSSKHLYKPASASVNRKKQEQGIQKENLALLRRLQEVKPSRAISTASHKSSGGSSSGRHFNHHNHHTHHHHHHTAARSCSATARRSGQTFSNVHHPHPIAHPHHTPKETAL